MRTVRFVLEAPTLRSFFWRIAYSLDFKTARVLLGNRPAKRC